METRNEITAVEDLPLALTVEQLAKVLRIGRGNAYRLVQQGEYERSGSGGKFECRKRSCCGTLDIRYDFLQIAC